MLDPDGSFHTQKKKTLSNTWILTEVQSPIKAQNLTKFEWFILSSHKVKSNLQLFIAYPDLQML